MGYDAWLEAPYVARAKEEELFETFCEQEGIDFDDPTAEAKFQAWLDDEAEAAAEARAEARMEDAYFDGDDRDVW